MIARPATPFLMSPSVFDLSTKPLKTRPSRARLVS